jgi:type I restriction enzyme S subunit
MATTYQKTKDYKETQFSWTGNIPHDWEIEKVKAFFYFSKERASDKENDILSLTLKGIKVRDISGNEGQLAATYENYSKLRKGDVVLNPMDLISGWVTDSDIEGIISPAYKILRLKKGKELNVKFISKYLQWHWLFEIFFPFGQGVSVEHRWTLGNDTLMNFPILIPPIKTQERIANFLDEKTATIDIVIEKKQKLIELLKEQRTAIITKAVTKGLDPKAKMKNSGMEWIGEIPVQWEVKPLKSIFKYHFGGTWGDDEFGNKNDKICVRVADFDFDNLKLSREKLTMRNIPSNQTHKYLKNGDILLEKSGGGEKTPVGRAVLFDFEDESVCSNFIEKMVVNDIENSIYVVYLMAGLYFSRINTKSIKQTTGIQNLDISNYLKEFVPYADVKDQKHIVEILNSSMNKIDSLIKITENQIKKMNEYRASLIYNAVTGKITI